MLIFVSVKRLNFLKLNIYKTRGEAGSGDTHLKSNTQEADTGGSSQVQGQTELHGRFEGSLKYTVRPCLKPHYHHTQKKTRSDGITTVR